MEPSAEDQPSLCQDIRHFLASVYILPCYKDSSWIVQLESRDIESEYVWVCIGNWKALIYTGNAENTIKTESSPVKTSTANPDVDARQILQLSSSPIF